MSGSMNGGTPSEEVEAGEAVDTKAPVEPEQAHTRRRAYQRKQR
jgi:hypothetical protein